MSFEVAGSSSTVEVLEHDVLEQRLVYRVVGNPATVALPDGEFAMRVLGL